jgi:hypothetical protein
VLEKVNEWRDEVCIDHRLDLIGITGSDVGNGPASLLSDGLFGTGKKTEKGREGAAIDDDLSLNIVASDDVANRSKCRGLDLELDDLITSGNTAVEEFMSNSTRRRGTPASMTAWILSLFPSERYEIAQQESIKTSSSNEKINLASMGKAG